jgi:hypothetical protein
MFLYSNYQFKCCKRHRRNILEWQWWSKPTRIYYKEDAKWKKQVHMYEFQFLSSKSQLLKAKVIVNNYKYGE